jgi:uncharacterized ion transporter superfamily protein YfcC
LIFGCPKSAKFGSFLTAIIMVFALNSAGWAIADKAWIFFIVAMIILIFGAGARTMCGGKKCCGKSCDKEVVEA